MEDIIHEFINSLNRRPTTKETYRKALIEYSKWLGTTSPIGLNSNDIQRYKDYISSKNLSTSSVSAYLTAVRRLYDYLEKNGQIKENPAKKVKGGARPERHSTKPISKEDVKRLFDSIDKTTSLGLRDSVILNLMLRCGLSEIEIVRADVDDIKRRGNETIIYVQGKNKDRKDEYVVIPGEIAKEIENYLRERETSEPNEPLFWGVGNRAKKERITTRAIRARISQYFEKLGFNKKGITPYSLRHTAALMAIESGASVADVMKMLRVKTVDTALVYFEEAKELKISN